MGAESAYDAVAFQAPILRNVQATTDILVAKIRESLPDVVAIYLFGSRLTPELVDEDSDWDLAVLVTGGGIEPMTWWNLRYDLAVAIGVEKVDVVDLKRSDYIIRDEVLQKGRLLYVGDEDARVLWTEVSERLIWEWMPEYEESNKLSYEAALRKLAAYER